MINFFKDLIHKISSKSTFHIYTDGSQKNGWGSWAFIISQNNKIIHESSGRIRQAGSNQMEFQAALNALKFLPENAKAQLFTDSRILIHAVKGIKVPPAFAKEIREIKDLTLKRTISWNWVKAHSGVRLNERCDKLCIQARENTF